MEKFKVIALQMGVASLIVSLDHFAKLFGYEFRIDQDTANEIAIGVVAVIGVFMHHGPAPLAGAAGNAATPGVIHDPAAVGAANPDTAKAPGVRGGSASDLQAP